MKNEPFQHQGCWLVDGFAFCDGCDGKQEEEEEVTVCGAIPASMVPFASIN